MELVTIAYTADAVIGIIGLLGYMFAMGLGIMWLSSFYILSTWWDSHRIKSHSSSGSGGSSQASRQLKKINSFINPVTTTDILLN